MNLKKLGQDILDEDKDIRMLALTTAVQLDRAAVEEEDDLGFLKQRLVQAVALDDPDTVFLARKGLNRIEELMAGPAPAVAAPRPARPPAPAPDAVLVLEPDVVEVGDASKKAGLIETLKKAKDDPVALSQALAELARCRPDLDDCRQIQGLLRHPVARVRANAVEVLEDVDDVGYLIQVLAPLLEDENNRVRANVTKVLGRHGVPRVAETLKAMAASANLAARESAVYAMGFLKGAEIFPMLQAALRDPYEGVRLRAVRSLGRLKDPRALGALKPMLNDMDIAVCEEADRAIRFITMESSQPVREAFPEAGPGDGKGAAPEREAGPATPVPAAVVELGHHLFELCRRGTLKNPELNRAYYDVLKAKELIRRQGERPVDHAEEREAVQIALRRLEQRVEAGCRELAEQALALVRQRKLEAATLGLAADRLAGVEALLAPRR